MMMKIHPLNHLPKLVALLIIATLFMSPLQVNPATSSPGLVATDTACRFGITSVAPNDGYDLTSLGVGSYLDWGAVTNPSLPEGVEYIRVLRLRDDAYPQTLANLPGWVQANPGGVWVVGNEPDTTYENQDGILAEVYADRYYELARIIRQLDPTALIGFGPIVQPTPIRIRYLQRAWDRLKIDAGGRTAASWYIDFWSIHSFILNELPGSWGTGVPPGFQNDHDDAFYIPINHLEYTYSIDIFQQRIIAFRAWMAGIGERDKPLWITEYGSLFPSYDLPEPPNYYTVPQATTAEFMLATFDFMLSASDAQTGLPTDGNQLVQRWYWYSLNDHLYHFGGSIYNPDYPDIPATGPFITQVGEDFIAYQAANLVHPDLFPQGLSIAPLGYGDDRDHVNYRLNITVDNAAFNDASCAQLWVYDGDPQSGGTLIAGPLPASAFHANNGLGHVTVDWLNVLPLTDYVLYVHVEPIGITDSVPGNNWAHFSVSTALPVITYLTMVHN